MTTSALFSSALSSLTSTTILSKPTPDSLPLHYSSLHQSLLLTGPLPSSTPVTHQSPSIIAIFLTTLSGSTTALPCTPTDTIATIKQRIFKTQGTPVDQQKLLFSAQQLESSKTLDFYGITDQSTVTLIEKGRNAQVFHVPEGFRDKAFDFDFSGVVDDEEGHVYTRGGFEYRRPCGWRRLALNVLDKYDDTRWLGVGRQSLVGGVDQEWPVTYHGTSTSSSLTLAQAAFNTTTKPTTLPHSHGIYTTPDIDTATAYASEFTHSGERYKVLIQSRVDPGKLLVISNEESGVGEFWVGAGAGSVRCYGVCVKKVL